MPFGKKEREFWMEAAGGKCQYEFFVGDVLVSCSQDAAEVHHIMAASSRILAGLDPNTTTGLPLCKQHHRGVGTPTVGDVFEPDGCFHPDMNQALIDYRGGNQNSFRQAAANHVEIARNGNRVCAGDWQTDEYYTQKMDSLAQAYLARLADSKK